MVLKPEEHRHPHAANFYGIKEAWKPGRKCLNPFQDKTISRLLVLWKNDIRFDLQSTYASSMGGAAKTIFSDHRYYQFSCNFILIRI